MGNWKSASETSGWGTPGTPNSIFTETPAVTDAVKFSSTKISPDNDGNEDFLTINLNLQGTNNVVTVSIFDEAGNYIRKLASNLFVGTTSTLTWDGTGADGTMVLTGIYIILITSYNDSGNIGKWKKVCTVIRK
jgi:flagellar hook assembly protein FlgD